MGATKPKMAKSVSVAVCDHGSVWVRLHDAKGAIFAAACMPPENGIAMVDEVLTGLKEWGEGTATCVDVH